MAFRFLGDIGVPSNLDTQLKTAEAARRTQEQRRTETRRKLLGAAIALICEQGYGGLTTAEVATRSGLTRGAVQHHFGNADDICLALVDDFAERLDASKPVADAYGSADIEKRVHAAIDAYWRNFKDPHYVAVVLVWFGFRSNRKVYPKLALRMNAFERRFDREWQALFRDTGLARKKIAAVRHIAISALRGFAIRSVYRKRSDGWTHELAMLKKMITSLLAG